MKAFILAGGFATRLWPLTEKRAKPMLLIDGEPILKHILDQIPPSIEVYLLTNSQFEPAFKAFLKTVDRPVHIFCEDAHGDETKLGALAAVATAIKHFNIKDDLLVLAGDNLLPQLDLNNLFPSANEVNLAIKSIATTEAARSFGVVEISPSQTTSGLSPVVGFEEKPTHPKSTLVSTGFMGFSKAVLPALIDYAVQCPDALGGIIPELLGQQVTVKATEVQGPWFDVGSYRAYLEAHKTMQTKALKIAPTAQVTNCAFKGKVYIGAGARVQDSVLVDTVVYPHSTLTNCRISQSVIDENVSLEGVDLSMKLIRQGTRIHNNLPTLNHD